MDPKTCTIHSSRRGKNNGRRRRRRDTSTSRASWAVWMAASFAFSDGVWNASTMAFSSAPTPKKRSNLVQSKSTCHMAAATLGSEGLSRYFQGILSRTNDRQRFVTGQYPVIVTVEEDPTRKWLNLGRPESSATSVIFVNDTIPDRSLASYDRFQWLEDRERKELHQRYATASLELLAEINMVKPGYLQILSSDGAGSSAATLRHADEGTKWNRLRNSVLYEQLEDLKWKGPYRDRLWVTGFSLAGRRGTVKSMDVCDGYIDSVNDRSEAMTLWPNELSSVPASLLPDSSSKFDDALLVSDGFLVPGKDQGGIYVIKNPGNPNSEWSICLTEISPRDRWFYHRAVWVDLTGDGRRSILTARAKLQKVASDKHQDLEDSRPKNGQLVWLEMPKPHHYDETTGTPLEEDGTAFDPFSARHLPWKERVLATGPDVMFNIADLDPDDDTVEILASQFFDKKVTLHSIQRGPTPRVVFSRIIDDQCGSAFGGILTDLDLVPSQRRVVDAGSTVATLKPGDSFSHLLVTSHECNYVQADETGSTESMDDNSVSLDGGSLFAYRVPTGKDAWKAEPWVRTTVATGFKVKGQLWNVINPGAPGFVYTFHAKKDDAAAGRRPMIAVAGDCAESAYIFRPEIETSDSVDPKAQYKLMTEIKCGATVGSIAIGYEDLLSLDQESGYAKIYIPCYEKDKILVFGMGSGEDTEDDEGW